MYMSIFVYIHVYVQDMYSNPEMITEKLHVLCTCSHSKQIKFCWLHSIQNDVLNMLLRARHTVALLNIDHANETLNI